MYCPLCQKHVSHQPKDCPEGVDLWHGTRITSLSPISLAKRLNPSDHNKSRLGAGVYFTDKDSAIGVSSLRENGTGVVVIGCRVWLGNTKNFKNWQELA